MSDAIEVGACALAIPPCATPSLTLRAIRLRVDLDRTASATMALTTVKAISIALTGKGSGRDIIRPWFSAEEMAEMDRHQAEQNEYNAQMAQFMKLQRMAERND